MYQNHHGKPGVFVEGHLKKSNGYLRDIKPYGFLSGAHLPATIFLIRQRIARGNRNVMENHERSVLFFSHRQDAVSFPPLLPVLKTTQFRMGRAWILEELSGGFLCTGYLVI